MATGAHISYHLEAVNVASCLNTGRLRFKGEIGKKALTYLILGDNVQSLPCIEGGR